VRKPGGGRKPLTEVDPSLLKDLERLVDGDCRGDPEFASALDVKERPPSL
jgi:hypothetical protein